MSGGAAAAKRPTPVGAHCLRAPPSSAAARGSPELPAARREPQVQAPVRSRGRAVRAGRKQTTPLPPNVRVGLRDGLGARGEPRAGRGWDPARAPWARTRTCGRPRGAKSGVKGAVGGARRALRAAEGAGQEQTWGGEACGERRCLRERRGAWRRLKGLGGRPRRPRRVRDRQVRAIVP